MLHCTGENHSKSGTGWHTQKIRDRSYSETGPAVRMASDQGENPLRPPWDCNGYMHVTTAGPLRSSSRLLRSTSTLFWHVNFENPVSDDGHFGLVPEPMRLRPKHRQGKNEGAALPVQFSRYYVLCMALLFSHGK